MLSGFILNSPRRFDRVLFWGWHDASRDILLWFFLLDTLDSGQCLTRFSSSRILNVFCLLMSIKGYCLLFFFLSISFAPRRVWNYFRFPVSPSRSWILLVRVRANQESGYYFHASAEACDWLQIADHFFHFYGATSGVTMVPVMPTNNRWLLIKVMGDLSDFCFVFIHEGLSNKVPDAVHLNNIEIYFF